MHSVAFVLLTDSRLPQQLSAAKVKEDISPLFEAGLRVFDALEAGHENEQPGVILFFINGRADISPCAHIIERWRGIPAVIHGTAGSISPDGSLITTSTLTAAAALKRMLYADGRKVLFRQDTPTHSCSDEVSLFCRIAVAAAEIRNSAIGVVGGGESLGCDLIRSSLGLRIHAMDMLDLAQRSTDIAGTRRQEIIDRISSRWRIAAQPDPMYFGKLSGYYLVLSDMVSGHGLSAVTIDDSSMKRMLGFVPAPIYMLLSEIDGVSVIPGRDILGSACQLITKLCTGRDTGYLQPGELLSDGLLMYAPDFIIRAFTEGDTLLASGVYSGDPSGLVNVSEFETGNMTLSALYSDNGKLRMHICPGHAEKAPGWNEYGRRMSASIPSVCFVPDDIDTFVENICTDRYVVSYGDVSDKLGCMCSLLGIETVY